MASRSCSEIVKPSGCATWCEDQEGSPPRCGLIVGWMGSIFAEKALYGSDAVIMNPAKSGRVSGSASRGMRTGFCDFIFGAVRLSAVQDCLRNKRPYHGRSRIRQRLPPLRAALSDLRNWAGKPRPLESSNGKVPPEPRVDAASVPDIEKITAQARRHVSRGGARARSIRDPGARRRS